MSLYNYSPPPGTLANIVGQAATSPIEELKFCGWDFDAELIQQIVNANEKYVPELIKLVENALTADAMTWDSDEFDETASHAYQAIHILAHLKVDDTQRLLLALLLKPHKFQEVFSEFYSSFPSEVIATVCEGCLAQLSSIVKNTAVFDPVRASALGALTILAVNNKIERSLPIELFFELANSKEFEAKKEALNRLLDGIISLNPIESKDQILELYKQERLLLEHTASPEEELDFVFSPKYWEETLSYPLDIFLLIKKLEAVFKHFDKMEENFDSWMLNLAKIEKKKTKRKQAKLARKKNRK